MTRAALTKLLILVILAFIICLPEFFTLYRALKVSFLCSPYRPCERGNRAKVDGNGKPGGFKTRRKDMCDPSRTPDRGKWDQGCTGEYKSDGEGQETSWFMCETDMDMAEVHSNVSSSALEVHFQLSVELHLEESQTLSLTLYGRSNQSSLRIRPPEEEEEEEKVVDDDDEGPNKAFYCCLPAPSEPGLSNQSRCLLWVANQTVLAATAEEGQPWERTGKDEWRCVFRVLWLVLLCVVLLTIATTVLGQIYSGKHLCNKPKVQSVHCSSYNVTDKQLNDGGEEQTEIFIPRGIVLPLYNSHPWTELPPIPEVDVKDDMETLLDGTIDNCYTANLHHRIHLSTSSFTEEQEEEEEEEEEEEHRGGLERNKYDYCSLLQHENKNI